ncbi:MAG TPA: M20/M25/M40 family metallo-hydrolase [Bacteroidia bacterium]|nr:M20/M25/M40 family metallo-hydrolase [Bacteroidia bacterium]
MKSANRVKSTFLLSFFLIVFAAPIYAQQNNDSLIVKQLFNEALNKGKAHENLRYLCKNIGHRLSGSANAQAAVEYTKRLMTEYGFDKVYLQPVSVPKWIRGEKELAKAILSNGKSVSLRILALGNSKGTGPEGVKAQVVEVKTLKQLDSLGEKEIKGKIVFFNRPMNPSFITTFEAYGDAVDQRSIGASMAAKYGAVAVIVRSMTLAHDTFPHTGALRYIDSLPQIPAVAISTNDADVLSIFVRKDKGVEVYYKTLCEMQGEVMSYNVVGEIKGSKYPDEVIAVGGHLDSWDVGEGAHDDGAGCIQSIEALRLFRSLGIKPARTIRCVMFMNEENGLRGGKAYDEQTKGEKHIAAIESDRGGFTPRGFSIDTDNAAHVQKIKSWRQTLSAFGLDKIEAGGGGADISFLKQRGCTLIGFVPDSQRYFDFHHASTDVFEAVNKRELEMGAASMAALIWLLSENGL